LAQFAGRVRHVPQVTRSEVAQYFNAADCFIFPSLHEGSALVLREIYGAGLGAVHTRSAGKGVIPGKNGIVLEQATVSGVVDAIKGITRDPDCLKRWQAESWTMRGSCGWSIYHRNVAAFLDSLFGTALDCCEPERPMVGAVGQGGAP
jgi:starch synthase